MHSRAKVALAIALAVLVGGSVGAWLRVRASLLPAAGSGAEQIFTVSRGDSLARVARDLESVGLIRSAVAVEWLGRFRGIAARLHAGEYLLSPAQTPGEILGTLTRGAVATYAVVIPEGFTADQIADRLGQAGLVDPASFRAAVRDPAFVAEVGVPGASLEGYLFPETYRLARGLAPREIAGVMVDHFRAAWAEVAARAAEKDLSMHEAVTLASIVEKETGVPEERPRIAAVFRNRLARGMRLETDPTVIYGIEDFDGNLRRRDLENADNPYNTYRIRGLPPGPIASPGLGSLRAVVEPAPGDDLYFVSRNDGTHTFSRTYREHVIAVDKYQRRRGR